MKSVITVRCPECGGTLDIDVARQKVLAHRPHLDAEAPGKDKARLFDDVVKRVQQRENKAEDAFERAREDVKKTEEKLDALFGEMKKKIKEERDKGEEPGEDPRNLFWD